MTFAGKMKAIALAFVLAGLVTAPVRAETSWLLQPLSGAAEHHIAPWAYWHARAMVAAWAVLLPLGAVIARFFKVMPRQDWPRELDNKFWWRSHLLLQTLGLALCAVGLALAWGQAAGVTALARWHAWAGFAVAAIGMLQIAGGLARGSKGGPAQPQRRGDHYDMTRRRRLFERFHKSAGWLAVVLAMAVIAAGLVIADAPRSQPAW